MANYSIPMFRTASTSASLGSVAAPGSGMRRGEIYDVVFGSEAAAADNPFLYIFQRFTAPGTSTATTPVPLDPADAASAAVAGINHTVEPTYTANLILGRFPLNQRASFRWWTGDTSRLIYPATANNGIGIATPTATAVAISMSVYLCER